MVYPLSYWVLIWIQFQRGGFRRSSRYHWCIRSSKSFERNGKIDPVTKLTGYGYVYKEGKIIEITPEINATLAGKL